MAALRARHASSRGEFFQRESKARHHHYQQAIRDPLPSRGIPPSDPHGYSSAVASAAIGEVQRSYTADHFDRYRERARFLGGGARAQEFDSRGTYPGAGGRVYDTGSCHYN